MPTVREITKGLTDGQLREELNRRKNEEETAKHAEWCRLTKLIRANVPFLLNFAKHSSGNVDGDMDRCARREDDCIRCFLLDLQDDGFDPAVRSIRDDGRERPRRCMYLGIEIRLTKTPREERPIP